jgi:hypothetical protein
MWSPGAMHACDSGGGELFSRRFACHMECSDLNWRRALGAILMIIGGAIVAGMIALAWVVIANFVEWDNAADALGTVAMISLPPIALGALLVLLGRWTYGGWRTRAPVVHISSLAIRLAGLAVTLALGAMFLFLVVTGVGPDDREAATTLGLGAIAGIVMILAGFLLKPRRDETV